MALSSGGRPHDRDGKIVSRMGLVRAIASGYHRKFRQVVELEDLISEGMLGLVKAVDRYDISKGASLDTYAHRMITWEIMEYLRRMDFLSRGERKAKRSGASIHRSFVDVDDVELVDPHDIVNVVVAKLDVVDLLNRLNRQQRYYISEHYLKGFTQREIAERVGLASWTVFHVIRSAIRVLQDDETYGPSEQVLDQRIDGSIERRKAA